MMMPGTCGITTQAQKNSPNVAISSFHKSHVLVAQHVEQQHIHLLVHLAADAQATVSENEPWRLGYASMHASQRGSGVIRL